jgi:hypothetical protein
MGNCCGGGENQGEITMQKGGHATTAAGNILDDRTVAGLKGNDKIILIIKI